MKTKFSLTLTSLLVFFLAVAVQASSTYKILHTFGPLPDGGLPTPGLVLDSSGNLYGTTSEGGTGPGCGANAGCGTVFKQSPNQDGSWTESILFKFLGDSATGAFPGGLIFDASGNLYGTTTTGGPCNEGCGTVFKLTPNQDGTWTHTVLFDFPGRTDGTFPTYGLTFDSTGNIYGSTNEGGTRTCGTIYQLSPTQGGSWTHTVLYNFSCNDLVDGSSPSGGLVLGTQGELYGTLRTGGAADGCFGQTCGRAFVVARKATGTFAYHTLYSFTGGADGGEPETGLTLHAGKLYGTTDIGGDLSCGGGSGCGVLFSMTLSNGAATEQVLHTFEASADGALPVATPTFDTLGRLYVASQQLSGRGFGAVLGHSAVLHDFGDRVGGEYPNSLTVDSSGNVFGTTLYGGLIPCGVNASFGCGVVFEITPQ